MPELAHFNVSRITDRLLVGGGLVGPAEADFLAAQGVSAIISAAAELDDSAIVAAANAQLPPGRRLVAYHVDWQDDGTPKPIRDFLSALLFVQQQDALYHLPAGKQIGLYVHCAAGCNRGPMLACYLLAALSGLRAVQAWDYIKGARPIVTAWDNPNYRKSIDDALADLRPFGAITPETLPPTAAAAAATEPSTQEATPDHHAEPADTVAAAASAATPATAAASSKKSSASGQ